MKKFFLAGMLGLFTVASAFAQSSDRKNYEVFVGFSRGQIDRDFGAPPGYSPASDKTSGFNGFEASAVFNVSLYIGFKADVSGSYNKQNRSYTVPTRPTGSVTLPLNVDNSLYNFLGGVQLKDNSSRSRLKPFAHALIGGAKGSSKVDATNLICLAIIPCPNGDRINQTGFAGAFGGGLDVRLNKRLDLRLIQVDYNPIKFDSGTSHNVRYGFGVVF